LGKGSRGEETAGVAKGTPRQPARTRAHKEKQNHYVKTGKQDKKKKNKYIKKSKHDGKF